MPPKKSKSIVKEFLHNSNSLKILSFDVGIKNLSFCYSEISLQEGTEKYNIQIKDWGIIDLTIPVQNLSKPWNSYILSHYEKMKKEELEKLCQDINLIPGKNCSDTKKKLTQYITTQGIQLPNPKTAKNIENIAPIMFHRLDQYSFISEIEMVLIENQPCLRNPTMKSVQMLLYSYFTLRRIVDSPQNKITIFMVSANNKTKWSQKKLPTVKDLDTEFSNVEKKKVSAGKKYRDTKNITIKMVDYWFNNKTDYFKEWYLFFQNHSKKDDLADSFLQICGFLDSRFKEQFDI